MNSPSTGAPKHNRILAANLTREEKLHLAHYYWETTS